MADRVERVVGRAAVLRGDDIDTDRIIPARFLRCVVFDGLGEHAPQALLRRGFQAFVGGSFAEIFFGNCTALGLPCVTLAPADLSRLMDAVEADPAQEVVVDVDARSVRCRAGTFPAGIPDGTRGQLLDGSWNATAVLLEAGDAIERTAARLPYVSGFDA